MNAKKLVIFVGKYSGDSTIEHVEAIARAFPEWSLCVIQEFPARRWRPYLKGKVKRLAREPISYPLELLARAASLAGRRLARRRPRGGPVPSPGAVHLPESLADIASPNVTYRSCPSLHAQETVRFVRDQGFWLGLSIGSPILRPKLFKLPELGTLNIHKSLLPGYRGMPPGFWELHDGAAETGVSVHWVEEGLDTGDIVYQRALAIPPFSTVKGLQAQLDALGTEVLLDALRRVEEGRRAGTPQGHTDRPANRRPSWLQARALDGRLRRRRQLNRSPGALLRRAAKGLVLLGYVYAYAPARNRWRARRGANHTVVLLYHRINDGYLDATTGGVEQFDRQLSILEEHYEVLDLGAFLAGRGGKRDRPAVVITFDDGYEDNYLAAILLRRHGLPCTFFLSTGIVGTDRAFPHDLERLGHRVPALSWEQVERMAEWGFTFGNHTVEHTRVSLPPHEDAMVEIARAKSDLEHRLGANEATRSFAYPYGKRSDITEEIREGLPALGIDLCFTAYGGVNAPDFDRLNVLRSGVDHTMSDLNFRAVIEGWSKPI